ncbi:MAG: hypothetical protein ABJA37_05430 [Ferruginibacter sp.]
MKYILLLSFFAIVIFGCAKKNVPVTTPAPAATAAVPSPDAAKIDAATSAVTSDKSAAMGHDIYTAKCGRCHGLKKVDDYTTTQWAPIMERMAIKARLDSTEKANVIAYVQLAAKAR